MNAIFKFGLVIFVYLFCLAIFHPETFTTRFDPTLIDRYYLSQDIPVEVPGKRLFLSDSEIHIAAGYLYVTGKDPSQVNFQHPPFLKYLFGSSIVLFNNPLIIQVGWGVALLCVTYWMAMKVYDSEHIALGTSALLATDRLFWQVSSSALLDLGQATLLIAYVTYSLSKTKKSWIQGIILGLFAGSKFWAAPLFIVGIVTLYEMRNKQFRLSKFCTQLIFAFLTFTLLYLPSFYHQGLFNIFFFEAKTLKYWLNHSVASQFGASSLLFLTGWMKSWWGDYGWIRPGAWSILWPISCIFVCVFLWRERAKLLKAKLSPQTLTLLIPMLYLGYLSIQAPFNRYFILIIPFFYMHLAYLGVKKLQKKSIITS